MSAAGFDLEDEAYSALIFDCDGTLVDTAPIHYQAVNEALRPLGVEMSAEWYYARVGLTPAALFAEFEAKTGVAVDTEDLERRYGPFFMENLHRVEEITAVAEVARSNHGRVPMAVASNGHLLNVEATLAATGLLGLFDHVVTAEQVAHGKPAPDVFLEAARRMGVPAEECIVFEDSEQGLEAARRAGMRTRDVRIVAGDEVRP